MTLRFASLGSGSRGNGLVVEAGGSRVLLDCGFTPRECERRLGRLGLAATDLAGVVVTHEHDDHIGHALPFAARHGLRVWLTYGTWRAAGGDALPAHVTVIDSHDRFAVGDLCVEPFPVPHDAREPVQFAFSDGVSRLGVLTDIGAPTRHVVEALSACDGLVLECNHDREMLARGPYPAWLKERIGGAFGHLANDAASALLAMLDTRRLRHLVAAHLSESNNTPELACAALAEALGCAPHWIGVASQQSGFDWREL